MEKSPTPNQKAFSLFCVDQHRADQSEFGFLAIMMLYCGTWIPQNADNVSGCADVSAGLRRTWPFLGVGGPNEWFEELAIYRKPTIE